MRKTIFLIICMMICGIMLSTCSVAETSDVSNYKRIDGDFSIRNGIFFGMTPTDIIKREDGKGEENSNFPEFINIGYSGFDSLAGIPIEHNNSDVITYRFDKWTNELMEISYWFGYYDYNGTKYFSELKNNISNKYGNPTHDNDGEIFPSPTTKFESDINFLSGTKSYDISNYSEWIVQYDNYYVLIDLYLISGPSSDELSMGYKIITNEEMASYEKGVVQNQQDRMEEINSDL